MTLVTKLIFKQIKKMLEQNAGMKIDSCEFHINYVTDEFIITAIGEGRKKKLAKKVSEQSDLSNVLTTQINSHVNLKKIDVVEMTLNFTEEKQKSEIYGEDKTGKNVKIEIEKLF